MKMLKITMGPPGTPFHCGASPLPIRPAPDGRPPPGGEMLDFHHGTMGCSAAKIGSSMDFNGFQIL